MSKQEILNTRYGEMRDMISCYLIDNNRALPAKDRTYEEAMRLE